MAFTFNTTLKDSTLIQGERINLELLLTDQDYKDLINLSKKNYKDDYIKSLYAEKPDDIDFDHTKFLVSTKYRRNKSYGDETTRFAKLYYVIKLKCSTHSTCDLATRSGEIIGTFEIYGCNGGVEFGLFIDQDHSHQKYGTEALNIMIDFLKKNSSIEKIKWECDTDNKGSVGVAKNCGFVHQSDSELYKGRMSSCFCLNQ